MTTRQWSVETENPHTVRVDHMVEYVVWQGPYLC